MEKLCPSHSSDSIYSLSWGCGVCPALRAPREEVRSVLTAGGELLSQMDGQLPVPAVAVITRTREPPTDPQLGLRLQRNGTGSSSAVSAASPWQRPKQRRQEIPAAAPPGSRGEAPLGAWHSTPLLPLRTLSREHPGTFAFLGTPASGTTHGSRAFPVSSETRHTSADHANVL